MNAGHEPLDGVQCDWDENGYCRCAVRPQPEPECHYHTKACHAGREDCPAEPHCASCGRVFARPQPESDDLAALLDEMLRRVVNRTIDRDEAIALRDEFAARGATLAAIEAAPTPAIPKASPNEARVWSALTPAIDHSHCIRIATADCEDCGAFAGEAHGTNCPATGEPTP